MILTNEKKRKLNRYITIHITIYDSAFCFWTIFGYNRTSKEGKIALTGLHLPDILVIMATAQLPDENSDSDRDLEGWDL